MIYSLSVFMNKYARKQITSPFYSGAEQWGDKRQLGAVGHDVILICMLLQKMVNCKLY